MAAQSPAPHRWIAYSLLLAYPLVINAVSFFILSRFAFQHNSQYLFHGLDRRFEISLLTQSAAARPPPNNSIASCQRQTMMTNWTESTIPASASRIGSARKSRFNTTAQSMWTKISQSTPSVTPSRANVFKAREALSLTG
jgi:hypothetical protein